MMAECKAAPKLPVIGIDLGTTNTCVAVYRNGRAEVIANDMGSRTTPSYVAFNDREHYVGSPALEQMAKNPRNTVYEVKRLLGRNYDDDTVQEDVKRWPFAVVDEKGSPKIEVRYKKETKRFAPEELSAMVLRKMKETADRFLDCDIKDAVITVPAYFNNAQRQATIDAGKIAGLNVLRIINEPTAAALAYGLNSAAEENRKVLIYDLGGGTFDVSIVTIEKGPRIRVLATAGDPHLGGVDFDDLLVKYLAKKFRDGKGNDVYTNPRAVSKLKKAAEKAKIQFSYAQKADIDIECLMDGEDFAPTVSRARFEELCSNRILLTLSHVEDALMQAGLTKQDIDEVVLVGGSTRIPKVKQTLQEYFSGRPVRETINPDEAVAIGAAIQAAILNDDLPLEFRDMTSSDITSLSLGIEQSDETMLVIIPRNTRVPCTISEELVTVYDNQTSMTLPLYEGEKKIAAENNHLGVLHLDGFPPASAGVGTALVTFNYNENGILKVSAREAVTGNVNTVAVRMREKGLSDVEVKRMIEEAEKAREEEARELARVGARNILENLVHYLRSIASFAHIGLADDEKRELLERCAETLAWLEEQDGALEKEYRGHLKSLNELCIRLKINNLGHGVA